MKGKVPFETFSSSCFGRVKRWLKSKLKENMVTPCFFLSLSHLLDPLMPCEIKFTLIRKLAASGIHAKA